MICGHTVWPSKGLKDNEIFAPLLKSSTSGRIEFLNSNIIHIRKILMKCDVIIKRKEPAMSTEKW